MESLNDLQNSQKSKVLVSNGVSEAVSCMFYFCVIEYFNIMSEAKTLQHKNGLKDKNHILYIWDTWLGVLVRYPSQGK